MHTHFYIYIFELMYFSVMSIQTFVLSTLQYKCKTMQIPLCLMFCLIFPPFKLRRSLSIAVDGRPNKTIVSLGQYILIEGDDDDNPYVAQLLKLFSDGKTLFLRSQFCHFDHSRCNV